MLLPGVCRRHSRYAHEMWTTNHFVFVALLYHDLDSLFGLNNLSEERRKQ